MASNTQHTSIKLAQLTAQNRANNTNKTHIIVYRPKTKKYLIRQQKSKDFKNDIVQGETITQFILPIQNKQVSNTTKM